MNILVNPKIAVEYKLRKPYFTSGTGGVFNKTDTNKT